MAAALISNLLQTIQSASFRSHEEELTLLKTSLLRIQALVADAEEREFTNDLLKLWLTRLRNAIYDAEDVLDDQEQALFSLQSPTAKIRGIRESVEVILSESRAFKLKAKAAKCDLGDAPPLKTADESMIYGREEDKNFLVELIRSQRIRTLTLVPIVGPLGVGKTTLAQLVYDDSRIRDFFDARGWVSLPKDFDLVFLMKSISESLSGWPGGLTDPSHLRQRLLEQVRGRRYLLVLDDFRNENKLYLESLQAPLASGLEGSVVMILTGSEALAESLQTVPFYNLQPLPVADCRSLFQCCAFGDHGDHVVSPNLIPMEEQLFRKLKGSPLAAKMVGSLLKPVQSNEQRWREVLQSEVWNWIQEGNEIFPSLMLSYHDLPSRLKLCFLFCALFHVDYSFKRDRLVRLWMAQGFIESSEGRTMEDIGMRYCDELVRRSFLQLSAVGKEEVKVHHLLHDLACSILGNESYRVEDGCLSSIPQEVQQCSVILQPRLGSAIKQTLSDKRSHLHSFLVINRALATCDDRFCPIRDRLHLRIRNVMFTYMDKLRVLDLSQTGIEELPDSVGKMRHLRYLALNGTKIRVLPESLSELYNLQTLELQDCTYLDKLPRGTKNLTNLRHLYLSNLINVVSMPHGIGCLTSLQTLTNFHVGMVISRAPGSNQDLDVEHCVIAELKKLVNLRGELEVSGLENVADVEDAKEALIKKEHIEKLTLHSCGRNEWDELSLDAFSLFDGAEESVVALPSSSSRAGSDNEMQDNLVNFAIESEDKASKDKKYLRTKAGEALEESVFDALRPHTNIVELVIRGYHSMKFPSWIANPSFINIVNVRLGCSSKCKILPALGQLPNLRQLIIQEFSELEHVGHEFCIQDLKTTTLNGFPSLETLHFECMYKWEEWVCIRGDFPCLRQLHLHSCPKLKRMPLVLPSLAKLVMWRCEELIALPELPSLTHLELQGHCSEKIWSSMPSELLARLQSLKICGVQDSSFLPLHSLFALEELEIMDSSFLKSRDAFTWLEQQSYKLPVLKYLKIYYCHGLQFSVDLELPQKLEVLEIFDCPLLTVWCQTHGRSKLVQVPRIILDKKDFHPLDTQF